MRRESTVARSLLGRATGKLSSKDTRRPAEECSTPGMLAATSDLHDVGFFGFLAVFATVFAAFFRRTIARSVSTFSSRFFGHQSRPPRTSVGDYSSGWGKLRLPC